MLLYFGIFSLYSGIVAAHIYSKGYLQGLQARVVEAFDHAYMGYKEFGLPYDELDPIACIGVGFRPNETVKGDFDYSLLGGLYLTLVDSLGTLAIMDKKEEFRWAVSYLHDNLVFDLDNMLNLFELNIRVLGSLLSGHLLAINPHFALYSASDPYRNQLLELADDLGGRIIRGYDNSLCGIPYNRINLFTLENGGDLKEPYGQETNTAAACSLLLEFATLSRLTNNPVYENAAANTLSMIWSMRYRSTGLLGSHINISSCQFFCFDSGIGANLDSAFEYMLKAGILLNNDTYIKMFYQAYVGIMRYVRQPDGFCYLPVSMYTGRAFVQKTEGMSAFFPGLQVLLGDLYEAIHHHLYYYTQWLCYHSLPEGHNVALGEPMTESYLLRPELMESTYFLYRATKDPFYLRAGEIMLDDIVGRMKTRCGFTPLNNDGGTMPSYFLAETLKYLYLLFSPDHIIHRNEDLAIRSVFSTEAQLLFSFETKEKFRLDPWEYCIMYPSTRSPLMPFGTENSFQISEALGYVDYRGTDLIKRYKKDPYLAPYNARKCPARMKGILWL